MMSYPQTRQDDSEITAWNAAAGMVGNLASGNIAPAAIWITDRECFLPF